MQNLRDIWQVQIRRQGKYIIHTINKFKFESIFNTLLFYNFISVGQTYSNLIKARIKLLLFYSVPLLMANIKWWSNLMFLLNTKLRFAKSTLKLDTAHTVRGASSSMDHRTYQLSKLYLSSKHSHQKPKTMWSVSQAYSHLLQVPKIRRPNAKRTLCRKEKRCYLKQASSTSSTFLRASLLRMWARKARSQRPPRYKCNRSEELSTARC